MNRRVVRSQNVFAKSRESRDDVCVSVQYGICFSVHFDAEQPRNSVEAQDQKKPVRQSMILRLWTAGAFAEARLLEKQFIWRTGRSRAKAARDVRRTFTARRDSTRSVSSCIANGEIRSLFVFNTPIHLNKISSARRRGITTGTATEDRFGALQASPLIKASREAGQLGSIINIHGAPSCYRSPLLPRGNARRGSTCGRGP